MSTTRKRGGLWEAMQRGRLCLWSGGRGRFAKCNSGINVVMKRSLRKQRGSNIVHLRRARSWDQDYDVVKTYGTVKASTTNAAGLVHHRFQMR